MLSQLDHARLVLECGPRFMRFWLPLRRAVRGWLSTRDAAFLHRVAAAPGDGIVVEIGSAFGLSTIALAKGVGSRPCGNGIVWTIDTHTFYGSEAELRSNLARFGLERSVMPITADSATMSWPEWMPPIRLLYIDGLHTYEGVRADIDTWLPRVAPKGLIVFDDYYDERPEIGVRRAVDELVASGHVEGLHTVDHLTWVVKRGQASRARVGIAPPLELAASPAPA